MANADLWSALLGSAAAGIKGYRSSKGSGSKQPGLSDLLRMMQFERSGRQRQEDIDYRTQKDEKELTKPEVGGMILNDEPIPPEIWDLYGVQSFPGATQSVGQQRSQWTARVASGEIKKGTPEYQRGIDMGWAKGPKEPPVVDPTVKMSRDVLNKQRIENALREVMGGQQDREFNEYTRAGGLNEPDLNINTQQHPETIREGGGPWNVGSIWGAGGKQVPNPLYEGQQEYNFWDMANPQARDSANVLAGGIPGYDEYYGGQQGQNDPLSEAMQNVPKPDIPQHKPSGGVDNYKAAMKVAPSIIDGWDKMDLNARSDKLHKIMAITESIKKRGKKGEWESLNPEQQAALIENELGK